MQENLEHTLFRELDFNLKAIRSDITALVKGYESLYKVNFKSTAISVISQLVLKIQSTFESLITLLEHIVTYHISESLRIIAKILGNPLLLENSIFFASFEFKVDSNQGSCKGIDDTQIKTLDEIDANLRLIHPDVNSILEQVSLLFLKDVYEFQFNELEEILMEISKKLLKIGDKIINKIHPKIIEVYIQSVQLYYKLDPEMAKQDEEWNLLTTPLREDIHILACSLDICPNCGALLTSEDRTFTGSYCENCRTLWTETV